MSDVIPKPRAGERRSTDVMVRTVVLRACDRFSGTTISDRIETAIREAARFRGALERIAAGDVPGVTFADDDLISALAQAALDGDDA